MKKEHCLLVSVPGHPSRRQASGKVGTKTGLNQHSGSTVHCLSAAPGNVLVAHGVGWEGETAEMAVREEGRVGRSSCVLRGCMGQIFY